jgi:hypothetical protein
MSVTQEFATVDLLLASSAETRGVDAFALSLIKAERQLRRLLTYLVFQSPEFESSDISRLREALAENRRIYTDGFIRGIDELLPVPLGQLVGSEYPRLYERLQEALSYRNKIFHGQLTDRNLSRDDLLALIRDLRQWCTVIANAASNAIGYNGFARNSFRKSTLPEMSTGLKRTFRHVDEYKSFLHELERRPVPSRRSADEI